MSNNKTKIVAKEVNFADWYTSVINNAEMFMYGLVKGTMVFTPYSWAIWETIQKHINYQFKKLDIYNVALPFLIPLSEFQLEKKHVEGFAPELYTVDRIGDKKLETPLVIRPTSEVAFCRYFSHIASSYKSLPIKLNQWCSVMRGEKTTRPFLRNSEFHWQEMHSIHSTENEAIEFTKKLIDLYENFVKNILCIPVLKGEKTIGERFAGASNTFTIEALMQDGQMLQCATSHFLNQTFSKPYQIKFQNKDNSFDYAYQTSAGISTRIIGALIMVHSDNEGLVLPTKIAPHQIIINAINYEKTEIAEIANNLQSSLINLNYRVKLENSDKSFQNKVADAKYKGYPLQITVGNKTITNHKVTIFRRDINSSEDVDLNDLSVKVQTILKEFDNNLYKKALNFLQESIVRIKNIEDLKEVLKNNKIALAYWAGDAADEQAIKELTGATPRCIISVNEPEKNCFFTQKKSKTVVVFGRAY